MRATGQVAISWTPFQESHIVDHARTVQNIQVPAGTLIHTIGDRLLWFRTTHPVWISGHGVWGMPVAVEAVDYGREYNLPSNTEFIIPSLPAGREVRVSSWNGMAGGSDPTPQVQRFRDGNSVVEWSAPVPVTGTITVHAAAEAMAQHQGSDDRDDIVVGDRTPDSGVSDRSWPTSPAHNLAEAWAD